MRASRVIPGGVNSPARAFGAVGGEPPFMARAEGAYLFDIDGHTYIDYIGSWGPMILGPRPSRGPRGGRRGAGARARASARRRVREIEIAEAGRRGGPVDREGPVRLVGDRGGDVGRAGGAGRHRPRQDHQDGRALSRARRCPARPGRLGRDDARHAEQPRRDRRGRAGHDPLPVQRRRRPWPTLFERFPGQIAAVLLEPIAGNMGLVPPEPGYLEALRELTEKDGALLDLRRGDDRLPRRLRRGPGAFTASRPT